MPRLLNITTGLLFTAVLVGLGYGDATLTGNRTLLPAPLAANLAGTSGSAVVAKQEPLSVSEILAARNIETTHSSDESILDRVLGASVSVSQKTLLVSGDRLGTLAWVISPEVKTYFGAIKEALQVSFSPSLKNLHDETLTASDRPIIDLLTFTDPAISEDRLTFLRVRDRLYEIHTQTGKEAAMQPLLSDLSR